MSIIILQLIMLTLCAFMVATQVINEFSSKTNIGYAAKSFSIDFSSTSYSIESTFDEETIVSPSSIPVEFIASYSFEFSPSEDNAKDEDSSSGKMLTTTYSLEFSSEATSSSLSYLRRE